MPDGDMGERTEAPTARKLREARNRGQVAKSQDLSSAILLLGGTIMIAVMVGWMGLNFARVVRNGLTGDAWPDPVSADSMGKAFQQAMYDAGWLIAPVFVIAFLLAVFGQIIQVGWVISFEAIKPQINKLSPVSGIKKIFGLRGVVKAAMNMLKLIAMLTVAYLVVTARLGNLGALPQMSSGAAMVLIGKMVFELAMWLVILLILISVADLLYQRWQHTRDLKMTKQEVKDERRSMEGDPQIKGKRMQMYQQMVAQQIGKSVPEADVIINNPTHFSVAVRYDPDRSDTPIVTAKGADELAMRIRQLAAMNKVPMVSRPPLARALYWHVEVGQPIHPEHFEAIAEILAYVYRIDAKRAERMEEAREAAGVGV